MDELDGYAFELAERLKILMKDKSRNAFAKMCGIPESTFRSYFEGTIMSADNMVRIASAAGVSAGWLANGETSMIEGDTANEALEGFALVPRLDIQASAGSGALALNEEPNGALAFDAAWLRQRGINPATAALLNVRGDSMEPTLRDHDIMLVDTSVDEVRDNAIYIVIVAGLLLVKRIHLQRDGGVILISDNAHHPDETVPLAEVTDLAIACRVMWYGRSI